MTAQAIRFDEVRAWLFERALPLWAGAGLDRAHGGSVETLDLAGRDAAGPFKRTRVQARQVYAFTHAHLLGWDGPGLQAAEHCWDFVQAHGRREDGGWVRLLGRAGGVLDPVMDAYDMAFVLHALAWRTRAGDSDAMGLAHATLDALDRTLAVAPGQGWRTAEDDPRLWQNPHMHLLEASLELAEAGRDERFADMARGILALFRDRLFDRKAGVLPEYFAEGWAQLRKASARSNRGTISNGPGCCSRRAASWGWTLARRPAPSTPSPKPGAWTRLPASRTTAWTARR